MYKKIFDEIKYQCMCDSSNKVETLDFSECIYGNPLFENFDVEVMTIRKESTDIKIVIFVKNSNNCNEFLINYQGESYEELILEIAFNIIGNFKQSTFRHHRYIILKISELVYYLLSECNITNPQMELFKDIIFIEDYLITTYSRYGKINYPIYEDNNHG
uniref:Uncharacterized protein n=1 Tax=Macrococcoides caseolyticum TaxID=69966 RepID=A0A097PT64_9STAP|nr:hypothetical protein [Macrococcus caseolyticus]AIU53940.1 Hypothetical protein [Macrococcus caseolyticus]